MMTSLNGTLALPGDKSLSHRALMFASLVPERSVIHNLSTGQDVVSTARVLAALGTQIEPQADGALLVTGQTRYRVPTEALDCGNSGTTVRLMTGLLSGQGILATLTGDPSLSKRPMNRIVQPLTQMGAKITTQDGFLPLQIAAADQAPVGIHYPMPVASAQVKSAILLAGLYRQSGTVVVIEEPLPSRDHTERMLTALGVNCHTQDLKITLNGTAETLQPFEWRVPGDISSAAFWLVGASLLTGSHLNLKHVSLNPHRTGFLALLQTLVPELQIESLSTALGEPVGNIHLNNTAGNLSGNIIITPEMVPSLIDEIPILTILGIWNNGRFSVSGAEELRVKESDRLEALIKLLQLLNIPVESQADGFSFQGNPDFQWPKSVTQIPTHHDHRLIMALEIAALRANCSLDIEGRDWVNISYPSFYQTLDMLKQ